MASVVLHGDLKRFGGPFNLDVKTPSEAVRALCIQLKGFRKRLGAGQFKIIRKSKGSKGRFLTEDTLTMGIAPWHEIHITPVVSGSKGGGGKALIGLAVVAAAFTFGAGAFIAAGDMSLAATGMATEAFSVAGYGVSFSQIAGFGAAMIFMGVAQMLSQTRKTSAADTNASFLFSGPANVTTQGVSVPPVYGEFICSSVVISSELTAENI
jgi:predicted phage tail protein